MFYFFFARKHTGSYFPDQGSNLHCRLHWKGKASPLDRQGSPYSTDFTEDLRKDHFVCRDGQRWIYRRNNEDESIVIWTCGDVLLKKSAKIRYLYYNQLRLLLFSPAASLASYLPFWQKVLEQPWKVSGSGEQTSMVHSQLLAPSVTTSYAAWDRFQKGSHHFLKLFTKRVHKGTHTSQSGTRWVPKEKWSLRDLGTD